MSILRLNLGFFFPALAMAQVWVVTYHNDNARTGQNLNELLLTPQNVRPGVFGKRFSHDVDGAILGQPLYLPAVEIAGKGLHDAVYVGTAHDSVYAFDANTANGANAKPLWQVSFLNADQGITAVPNGDVSCPVIAPELGIVGTPVIDPASGTLYVIAETKEPGPSYVFRLHALDVASGAEKAGSPVEVQAPGFVTFEHKQRGGLLLSEGIVYTSWGSNCDLGDYHGWIIAYDASTLKQTAVFNVSPLEGGGSFWNAGGGPASDASGNVFVVSANGSYDVSNGGPDYGDSIIKLTSSPNLRVADYFTPFNQSYLNLNDIDVGSSGAVLLPDEVGSISHPHLLVTAGKEGRIYILDRDHLGGGQSESDTSAVASLPILSHSVFGSPAYYNGWVYFAPEFAPLRAHSISSALISPDPVSSSTFTNDALGAVPSISANGARDGILWMIPGDGNGALQAYDASDLGKQLYNSNLNLPDLLGAWVEFCVPTIADGKVFVGTLANLTAYGVVSNLAPQVKAATNAASFNPKSIAPGGLISLFGPSLALTTASASSAPLPISLTDVSVTINGIPAPLLYVSPTQINAQVPHATKPGSAQVSVRVGESFSDALSVNLQSAAPGIFAIVADKTGLAPGSFVSLYATGLGAVTSPIQDGAAAPAGAVIRTALDVTVTIGGVPAKVLFAGLAPGYPGVNQVNLQIPQIAPGTYPVVLTAGGNSSNAAMLTVGGN